MKSKLAYKIVRILLGLAWLFFGVVKFLPTGNAQFTGPAGDFFAAMLATGYFIPLVGVFEAVAGIMLIFNLWVPFSMVILSPIMLNIILFNLILAPSLVGVLMLLVLTALQVYVIYCTWNHYKSLFTKSK